MGVLASSGRSMPSILIPLICAVLAVLADDTTTSAEQDVPDWAAENAMQLTLSTSAGDWVPLQYTVIPLTQNLGLNESGRARGIIQIDGQMIAADASNYNKITDPDDVAYLSCDDPKDDSFIQPDKMLNDLMEINPKAIVLYSKTRNWCSLQQDSSSSYTNILSMADAAEATQALGYLNNTDNGVTIKVSITGNTTTSSDSDSGSGSGKNNSAVAMSILYSITGLITLLFLIIIATGAVRAHRYPERYGPRRAYGGQPRQSRAKGLARAVLDTIPIVKFGNPPPTKPDPELELENGTDAHNSQRTVSSLSEDRRDNAVESASVAVPAAVVDGEGASTSPKDSHAVEETGEDHLGCSICTEDFTVGEDVRVLPCRHQFHPACIDPWLINVSGTCPLCRYDLRPGQTDPSGSSSDALPPPLTIEGDDHDGPSNAHRTRLSRFFDINRLRQATVEEQMEALRQMRAHTAEAEHHEAEHHEADGEARGQRARFADKLKDRFRIRTRAQSVEERHDD